MSEVRKLGNRIDYTLSDGWSQENITFFNKAIPIILSELEALAGPSFTTDTFLIQYVLGKRGGIKIFNPAVDANPRIELGEEYTFKLLAHELYHAWLCPYNLGVNDALRWTSTLEAFEESMAHAAAEIIEEKYLEIDPTIPTAINRSTAIYDLRNQDYLTSQSFWGDVNGMNKANTKYDMGATAIRKILVMRPNFFKDFLGMVAEHINLGKGPVNEYSELSKIVLDLEIAVL